MTNPWEKDWSASAGNDSVNPWERKWGAPTPVKKVDKSRTWLEAGQDTGVQLAEGVNNILGAIPSLVAPESDAAAFFKSGSEYWRGKQSSDLLNRQAGADQRIKQAGEEGVWSQIKQAASEYADDPGLAARMAVTNIPSLIPGVGLGKLAQVAGAGAKLSAASQAALGLGVAKVTNSALNAGSARQDSFDDIKAALIAKGVAPAEAESMALQGSQLPALVGGVAGYVSGGMGLEKAILGQATKGTIGAASRKAAGSIVGEQVGEQIEEVAPKLASNMAVGEVDPTRSLTQDVGRTVVDTAVGAGPTSLVSGGVEGYRSYKPEAAAPITQPPAPASPAVIHAQESAKPVPAPDTSAAEAALFTPGTPGTPLNLTALDRVNEIDTADRALQVRATELNDPAGGYGPMFDQERGEVAAQQAVLAQERQDLSKDWPKAALGLASSFTTEAGARVEAQYALMEAAELVTSHDESLRRNPAYPAELQPRERDRAASEMQVSSIVQKLDPARLGLSADAANGAPIVGADGLVESGNARTIALKRVYQANGQKAVDYKQFLQDNAAQFGLAADAVGAMARPVLVRVRSTPVNRAEFARQANAPTVAQMSPSEQAKSDANRVDSMEDLMPDDNGDFANAASRPFIRRFMARLPITEQAGMMDADGNLSTTGYARVRNAVLAKAYGDSPVLARITESMDDNLRNVSRALMLAAPRVAQMRDAVKAGNRFDADITPDLMAAVEELSRVKSAGGSVQDTLAQTDLMGEQRTPEARQMLGFLNDNIRRPRRMADFINAYMDALDAAGDPKQGSMFGEREAPTKQDLLNAATKATQDETQISGPENAGVDAPVDAQAGQKPEDATGGGASPEGDGGVAAEGVAAAATKPAGQPATAPAVEPANGSIPAIPVIPKVTPTVEAPIPPTPAVPAGNAGNTGLIAGVPVSWLLANGKRASGEVVRASVGGEVTVKVTGAEQGAGAKTGSVFVVPQAKLVVAEPVGGAADQAAIQQEAPAAVAPATQQISDKAKWIKAIKDYNRQIGDTGPQLTANDGKLTFLGNPNSTKLGKALQGALNEALKHTSAAEIVKALQEKDAPIAPETENLPAVQQQLNVTFGGKTYPVASIEDAKQKWRQFRDTSDDGASAGVSQIGNGVTVNDQNGQFIAHISYNGRVWDGEGMDAKEILQVAQPPAATDVTGTIGAVTPAQAAVMPGIPESPNHKSAAVMPGQPAVSENGHFAAGREAHTQGQPRVLPSYFTTKVGKNPKDWYRGWDAANIAAPVASASPKADSGTSQAEIAAPIPEKNPITPQVAAPAGSTPLGKSPANPIVTNVGDKPKVATSANTVFTEDMAAAARARLKAKLGRINSGIDPETLMDGITLAGYHIEKGARTFSAYAKAMLDDMGDGIRPYLKQFYMAVKFDPRATTMEGMDSAASVESFDIKDAGATSQAPTAATLSESLYQAISQGNMPKDNPALKKLVEAHDGKPATPIRMKEAQEQLEAAIVKVSRDLVAKNEEPKSTFATLLRLYESQPNLNIRTSTSIANQAYSTPAPLAFLSSELAGVTRSTSLYEPTAGNGMLTIGADPKNVTANELEPGRISSLKALDLGKVIEGDALKANVAAKSQDRVMTNPPFGSVKDANDKPIKIKVDGYDIGQIDHLIAARALETMKDDGKAVLIIGANKVAGGLSTDDRIFFNWLYGHYNVTGHFEVNGDLYTRQGAGWPVRVISIDGRARSNTFAPVAGTIQRAENWSQVYEHYKQILDSSGRPNTGGGARPSSTSTIKTGLVATPGQVVPQVSGTDRRPASAGGTGRDGELPSNGGHSYVEQGALGDGDSEQRLGFEPIEPDRLEAARDTEKPSAAKPSGTAGADSLAEAGNQFQVPYTTRSSRKDTGVLIPSNMAQPTQDALSRLEDAVGDIDEFARKELGYKTVEELHGALMGLQVDSVAMAIYQIKQGKALIISDQTGIGKGRQAAAIIRWAERQGQIPVFISVKPSLFTDMFGDLADIGTHNIKPFIMNKDAWVAGDGGMKLFGNKPANHRRNLDLIAASGKLPSGSNAMFMTYSQINVDNVQRRALLALAPIAVLILDESHNAAGASATGDFMVSALDIAKGVTYLSATYAKRPDNMPLYFKTDIGDAVADTEGLNTAMASGGLPLQTVVSNNLVKAGQMVRRERSYDGVSIESKFDTPNQALHEKMSDAATLGLRAIVAADKMFHSVFVKQMAKDLAAQGASLKDNAGNQASGSVQHTEFSSIVHNFIKQMLLGLKAQTAADEAVASLKRGEKPIIAVENTMGSFLNEYANHNGIPIGGSLLSYDYRAVLSRALARTLVITEKKANGDEVKRPIPLSDLDMVTREAYDKAQAVIDGIKLDIPVSPIDWIRAEIIRAGYSVAEITGRNLAVDYTNPKKPVLTAVDQSEQQDKVSTTRKFNSGKLDALVLNVAGSTGISLHASEKFEDQRQRHMIVAQAAGDINIFMQMLGRVHRTGQVKLPKYTILSVDLPTEKRPTAVLSVKMKSLNANTSSNTESATSVKSADILNKYGDQIVNQYLLDNPELARRLGVDDLVSIKDAADDIARKATGRLALQPIEIQHGFYDEVEGQYTALIDYLNKTNQNELEPRTFDFDAQETHQEVMYEGPNKNTPFGEDAIYGEYSIKAQGKAMTPAEIRSAMAESLDGKTPVAYAKDLIDGLFKTWAEQLNAGRAKHGLVPGAFDEVKYTAFMKALYVNDASYAISMVNIAKKAIADGRSVEAITPLNLLGVAGTAEGVRFIGGHRIGDTFRVDINSETFNAVVTNIRNTHKTTGNPFSMSKIQVTVSLNGALRSLSIPATQFKKVEVSGIGAQYTIEQLFKEQPPNQRETAKIVTGNLLAAYGEIEGIRGTIITFTKSDETSEQGILLPKMFDYSKNTRGDYRLPSGKDALKFLQNSKNKDIGRYGIMSRDGALRVLPSGQGVRIQVPRSKLKGAKYFLDKTLLAITGDFTSSDGSMVAHVQDAKIAVNALDALIKKTALYALSSMADEARTITEGTPPMFSRKKVDNPTLGWNTSPDALRTMLGTPGYSQRNLAPVMRDVVAAGAIRDQLDSINKRFDSVGSVTDQGLVSVQKTDTAYINAVKVFAREHGLTVVVRDRDLNGRDRALHAQGFTPYTAPTENTPNGIGRGWRGSNSVAYFWSPSGTGVTDTTPLFSRAGTGIGMDVLALERLARRIQKRMPSMPRVNVLADPSAAPEALRDYIQAQGAWDDVEGATHKGELYLFASNLSGELRAEHVLAEHEAAHFGLSAILGDSLKVVMQAIYNNNAAVRQAATELQRRGKLSDTEAAEEVIVDISSKDLIKLKGWRKLTVQVRDWLVDHGFERLAAQLSDWLDGSLNDQQRADLFVANLVRAARGYVAGKKSRTSSMGSPHGDTRLSSTLADDVAKQEQWLRVEAQSRGYQDIDQLAEQNYPLFEKLAELWRKKNPAEGGVLLSRAPLVGTATERADKIIQTSAATAKPLDKLARGLSRMTGIERATSAIYDKAGFFLDRWIPETVKAGMVSDYGVPEAVIDQRAMLQGRQRVQLRQAGSLIEKLATLTRAESRVAYEWMNETDPHAIYRVMQGLPEESVKVLMEVQGMIDKLSKEAVRMGQLNPEAYEANKFAYLRRSYAKYTFNQTAGEKAGRARAISVLGDQYKGRGLTEAATMAQIQSSAPEWWARKLVEGKADKGLKGQKFLRLERRTQSGERTKPLDGMDDKQPGKLKEVHYFPAGEALPAKYADWTPSGTFEVRNTKGDKVVLWRDFTKDERENMGEIDEARFAIAKTLHAMIHDVEVGRYLEWLAHNQAKKEGETIPGTVVNASEKMQDVFKPGEWVKVPDSTIAGTSVLKYGKLAGRYLPGPVWNDLRQTVNGQFKPLGETYSKILTAWKLAKTALSPTVHINNIMSNFVMADWHDVTAGHTAKALRIMLGAHQQDGKGVLGVVGNKVAGVLGSNDRAAATEIMNRYLDSGGNIGSWATNEIAKNQVEPLLAAMEAELAASNGNSQSAQIGVMSALQHVLMLRLPSAFAALKDSKPGKAVKTEASAMIDLYQSEDDVFRLAAWLKAKEDGKTDMEAGKIARRSFMDYHINAPWVQALRNSVLPFVSYTYRAIPMLLETAGKKPHKLMKLMLLVGGLNALGVLLAGGGDEERKLLPEEKAGRIWRLVPKLIRMPWNDANASPVYLDIRRFIPVGDVFDVDANNAAIPMLPMMTPGGPLVIMAEVVLNKTGFTGKPITLETDTPAEQAAKVLDHLYKSFAPNMLGLPGTYATTGVFNAASGVTDKFGREQSVAQAMASSFGVKLESYPADVLRKNAQGRAQFQIMEIERNISALKRQRQINKIDDDEFQRKVQTQQEKKRRVMQGLGEKMAR